MSSGKMEKGNGLDASNLDKNNGAEGVDIETGTPPQIPKDDDTRPPDEVVRDDYGGLRFVKLLANIPGEGISDAYEAAFKSRGVDLYSLPFIKYGEWRSLQITSAEAVVKRLTGGIVTPQWVKALAPWSPAIDLVASYFVPSVVAAFDTISKRNSKKQDDKNDKPQAGPIEFITGLVS